MKSLAYIWKKFLKLFLFLNLSLTSLLIVHVCICFLPNRIMSEKNISCQINFIFNLFLFFIKFCLFSSLTMRTVLILILTLPKIFRPFLSKIIIKLFILIVEWLFFILIFLSEGSDKLTVLIVIFSELLI